MPKTQRWTNAETKAWLNNGRRYVREIEALEEAKAKVCPHGSANEFGLDADRQIVERRSSLAEISRAIYSVEDGALRLLLFEKYILRKTWREIAEDMNYDRNHVRGYLLRKAIQSVTANLNTL